MIRIHLGRDGLGNVRISAAPDLGAELTAAGRYKLRTPPQMPEPLLRQLYTRSISPDLASGVTEEYLSHLFARRGATPFTRALAEGSQRAKNTLEKAIENLRHEVLLPDQPGIKASVAARAAQWSHIAAAEGVSTMVKTLGNGIGLQSGYLVVPTNFEADLELGTRPLVIQGVALSEKVTLAEPVDDHLTVRIPIEHVPRRGIHGRSALSELVGSAKADVLRAVVASGGLTGRQLAGALAVSDATASRHASSLRRAGLLRTKRAGQTVVHVATPLGYLLVDAGAEATS